MTDQEKALRDAILDAVDPATHTIREEKVQAVVDAARFVLGSMNFVSMRGR